MYGESILQTYMTIFKVDSQWEFAVCLRELKQGLCINLEGWDGEGDGREFQKGRDIYIYIYIYLWASLVSLLVKIPPAVWEPWLDPWVGKLAWRRESVPTPIFWPEEFHGLSGPWGHKESDTTEQLSHKHMVTYGWLMLMFGRKQHNW